MSSASAQQGAPKWGAHVDVEAKPGTKRNIGEADFFLPLMQDERTLFFGNARLRIADHDNKEGNLGLGYRRMLEGGWNIGGYAYYDRRSTQFNNTFSQVMLGGEALGQDWDLRANAYRPTGTRVRAIDTASTASISGAAVVVSSVTREERALKGFDAEAGWRLPVFELMDARQLRVYLGGYRFSDDAVKVSGPRARVELAMAEFPGLWRGAQLFLGAETQHDDQRGSQSFLSVRLRIPLGGEDRSARKLTAQERRMTAPVVRDVDIVAPLVTRAPVVEAATALADGRAFSVVNSETTTGAALPGAVTAAGANSVVILSGTFNTIAATVMQPGQTLAGAISVRTASGRTATTPSATINAAVPGGGAVDAANNSTISGLTIRNAALGALGARGISVLGATGVTIANNTISASDLVNNSSNGIVVNTGGSATISGNSISALGNSVGVATAINVGATGTVTVANNNLSASGATDPTRNRFLGMAPGATVNAGSTGNTAAAGVCLGAGVIGTVSFTNGTTCP